MLSLSRHPGQEIVFPTLGIRVHLARIEGNTARIGIDAPRHIPVFRAELLEQEPAALSPATRSVVHELCNRLSKVTLSLHLYEKLREANKEEDASAVLKNVLAILGGMDREWVSQTIAQPHKASTCKALIVDDDSNERELLAGLLTMNGCECQTACDGEDALEQLAQMPRPDYLLLDMQMPRCDGKKALDAIRADDRYRGLKVFSISPTAPEELGITRGPDGIDAWFPKPLDPRRLWDAMQLGLAETPSN